MRSQTAFGGTGPSERISQDLCHFKKGNGQENNDILRIKFPREISQLRAAYQSELQQAAGGFVVLPLISLLVSQFPDVNNFLFSWLQPAMQALNH